MTFSPVTGGRSLILLGMLLFFFNIMVVRFEYCGVGVSLLFAIVTSTISVIQPILRQTLVGNVFCIFINFIRKLILNSIA